MLFLEAEVEKTLSIMLFLVVRNAITVRNSMSGKSGTDSNLSTDQNEKTAY